MSSDQQNSSENSRASVKRTSQIIENPDGSTLQTDVVTKTKVLNEINPDHVQTIKSFKIEASKGESKYIDALRKKNEIGILNKEGKFVCTVSLTSLLKILSLNSQNLDSNFDIVTFGIYSSYEIVQIRKDVKRAAAPAKVYRFRSESLTTEKIERRNITEFNEKIGVVREKFEEGREIKKEETHSEEEEKDNKTPKVQRKSVIDENEKQKDQLNEECELIKVRALDGSFRLIKRKVEQKVVKHKPKIEFNKYKLYDKDGKLFKVEKVAVLECAKDAENVFIEVNDSENNKKILVSKPDLMKGLKDEGNHEFACKNYEGESITLNKAKISILEQDYKHTDLPEQPEEFKHLLLSQITGTFIPIDGKYYRETIADGIKNFKARADFFNYDAVDHKKKPQKIPRKTAEEAVAKEKPRVLCYDKSDRTKELFIEKEAIEKMDCDFDDVFKPEEGISVVMKNLKLRKIDDPPVFGPQTEEEAMFVITEITKKLKSSDKTSDIVIIKEVEGSKHFIAAEYIDKLKEEMKNDDPDLTSYKINYYNHSGAFKDNLIVNKHGIDGVHYGKELVRIRDKSNKKIYLIEKESLLKHLDRVVSNDTQIDVKDKFTKKRVDIFAENIELLVNKPEELNFEKIVKEDPNAGDKDKEKEKESMENKGNNGKNKGKEEKEKEKEGVKEKGEEKNIDKTENKTQEKDIEDNSKNKEKRSDIVNKEKEEKEEKGSSENINDKNNEKSNEKIEGNDIIDTKLRQENSERNDEISPENNENKITLNNDQKPESQKEETKEVKIESETITVNKEDNSDSTITTKIKETTITTTTTTKITEKQAENSPKNEDNSSKSSKTNQNSIKNSPKNDEKIGKTASKNSKTSTPKSSQNTQNSQKAVKNTMKKQSEKEKKSAVKANSKELNNTMSTKENTEKSKLKSGKGVKNEVKKEEKSGGLEGMGNKSKSKFSSNLNAESSNNNKVIGSNNSNSNNKTDKKENKHENESVNKGSKSAKVNDSDSNGNTGNKTNKNGGGLLLNNISGNNSGSNSLNGTIKKQAASKPVNKGASNIKKKRSKQGSSRKQQGFGSGGLGGGGALEGNYYPENLPYNTGYTGNKVVLNSFYNIYSQPIHTHCQICKGLPVNPQECSKCHKKVCYLCRYELFKPGFCNKCGGKIVPLTENPKVFESTLTNPEKLPENLPQSMTKPEIKVIKVSKTEKNNGKRNQSVQVKQRRNREKGQSELTFEVENSRERCAKCRALGGFNTGLRFYYCKDCDYFLCGPCSKDHYKEFPGHRSNIKSNTPSKSSLHLQSKSSLDKDELQTPAPICITCANFLPRATNKDNFCEDCEGFLCPNCEKSHLKKYPLHYLRFKYGGEEGGYEEKEGENDGDGGEGGEYREMTVNLTKVTKHLNLISSSFYTFLPVCCICKTDKNVSPQLFFFFCKDCDKTYCEKCNSSSHLRMLPTHTLSLKEAKFESSTKAKQECICGYCSKGEGRRFYFCEECQMFICGECNRKHYSLNSSHHIISSYKLDTNCILHGKEFVNYCQNCNKKLCSACFQTHKNHQIVSFQKLGQILKEEEEEYHNKLRLIKEIAEINKSNLLSLEKENKYMQDHDYLKDYRDNLIRGKRMDLGAKNGASCVCYINRSYKSNNLILNDGLLTGHKTGIIYLWDINSQKKVRRFSSHSAKINKIMLVPYNKELLFVSISEDKTTKIWSISKEDPLISVNNDSILTSLEVLNDHTIAVGDNEGYLSLYMFRYLTDKEGNLRLKVHYKMTYEIGEVPCIRSICLLRKEESRYIVITGDSYLASYEVVNDNKNIAKHKEYESPHNGDIHNVTELSKGRFVTVGEDNLIKIWNYNESKCLLEISDYVDDKITCVLYLNDFDERFMKEPNHDVLLIGGLNKSIYAIAVMYDDFYIDTLKIAEFPQEFSIHKMSLLYNDDYILAAGDDGSSDFIYLFGETNEK